MKIKNELVSLKIGNKNYEFKNLILDEYLKRFVSTQLDVTSRFKVSSSIGLDYVFLKFDTPFENLSSDSVLLPENFDIVFADGPKSVITDISENTITTKYVYATNGNIYDYKKMHGGDLPFSDYYGKKIVAIGFAPWWGRKNKIGAVLDTSNYNIYMQEGQKIEIARKDTIFSDTLFWSNDKRVKGPVHLCPQGGVPLLYQDPYAGLKEEEKKLYGALEAQHTKGALYSVGLSSYSDYIDKEYIIGKDVQVIQNGAELIIKSINNSYNFEKELYPNSSIFPSSSLYPAKSNYKYVIFKYKVYQDLVKIVSHTADESTSGEYVYTQTDTGSYYYQAVEIDKFGDSNLKIKYERS